MRPCSLTMIAVRTNVQPSQSSQPGAAAAWHQHQWLRALPVRVRAHRDFQAPGLEPHVHAGVVVSQPLLLVRLTPQASRCLGCRICLLLTRFRRSLRLLRGVPRCWGSSAVDYGFGGFRKRSAGVGVSTGADGAEGSAETEVRSSDVSGLGPGALAAGEGSTGCGGRSKGSAGRAFLEGSGKGDLFRLGWFWAPFDWSLPLGQEVRWRGCSGGMGPGALGRTSS